MPVFHNPHHEKHRGIIYPPNFYANPMTCWQNSAIEQEITGSSTLGSYPAEGPWSHAHAVFLL